MYTYQITTKSGTIRLRARSRVEAAYLAGCRLQNPTEKIKVYIIHNQQCRCSPCVRERAAEVFKENLDPSVFRAKNVGI